MSGFLFECKKIVKKKATLYAISLTILAAIGLYILNYSVAENIQKGNISRLESFPEMFLNFANEAKEKKEKAIELGDANTAEELSIEIAHYQEGIVNYENLKKSYQKEDWKTIYERDLTNLQIFIDDPVNASMGIREQNISNFTIRATYEEIKLLHEMNSKPYMQNTIYESFLPTIYDNFTGSSLKEWNTLTKRYGREGFSYLVQLIQLLYIPAMVLIGCYIFGNSISSEATKKHRGINFYKVLPYSKLKLFFSKYLSGYLFLLAFSLIMLAVPLICSFFTNGLGSLNNPILVYEGAKPSLFGNSLNPMEDQFHFIDYQEYLWKVLLFLVLFSFFMYSIYFLLVLVFKNATISLILLGMITYFGMTNLLFKFNPFSYSDVHKIITGEIAALAFKPEISYQTGLLLYGIIGLVVSIISFLSFRFSKRINGY